MSENLQVNLCRIVPPEKLNDRFLLCGLLSPAAQTTIHDSVILAYVFEIHKPWFPSSKILETLTSTLNEQQLLLKPGPDVDSQFEALLRTVNQKLNTLSEEGETDWIGNFSGMIMALSGDELHFSETGHCPAYLLQNNRIRQISDNTGLEKDPHPLKTFANLASGHIEGNEHILIANHELYNEISLDALRRILNTSTPYTASMAIAKHLKKEKNPGVASIIIQVSTSEASLPSEPDSVLLNEVMQSTAKKVGKQLVPVGKTAGSWASTTLQVIGNGVKIGVNYLVTTIMPTVRKAGEQGIQALQKNKEKQSEDLEKPTTPPEGNEQQLITATTGVVERILPKAQREATIPSIPEEVPTQEEPENTSVIPASEFSLESTVQPQPESTPEANPSNQLKSLKNEQLTKIINSARKWLTVPLHKRIAALLLAVAILLPTIAFIRHQSTPSDLEGNSTSNQELIKKAGDIEKSVTTTITGGQQEEVAKKVEEGTKTLGQLKSPTEAQIKEAERLRALFTQHSDTLTNTTRLQQPTSQHVFPALSQLLVARAPFFYGANKSSPSLLRSGTGDPSSAQSTINLPGTQDSIISLSPSTEEDTAAVALTSQSKVYRIVTQGSQSFLREIKPETGTFAKSDAIQTYAGNIYTLDGTSGLLWKYTNTGTSYSKGTSVIDPVRYAIKDSLSLAIDGDIYILKNDGSLLKFTRGTQDTSFSLKGLPYLSRQIIQPRQVITNEDTDNIYILDAGLSSSPTSTAKVIMFTKDGTFKGQYGFPASYTNIQAFDIDPQQNTLWVVNGKEISEFKLP